MQGKGRAASAALAVVLALGAAGCGAGDEPAKAAPLPPRPAGTGPLTKDVVRADVDGAVEAAEAPPGDREFSAGMEERLQGCAVHYKGFGDEEHPGELARYEAVTAALRERAWRFAKKGNQHEERDGKVFSAQEVFTQRGWTLVAEFRPGAEEGRGTFGIVAYDDACLERTGLLDKLRGTGA
ncbi:hypothetical protein AB0E83_17485 [Streptomyces sp. NPDC035033]|uniref:hypothetical protein n=1 Tax=Streptomyces sp. NPDC035033 TaxID=3155368 RepID=UPI0033EC20EC